MTDQRLPEWTRLSADVRVAGLSSLDELSRDWAWGGATGDGARVAIVDSGIDADDERLDGAVDAGGGVALVSNADGLVQQIDGPHGDSWGHGTTCAGIVHSVAPAARITSIKVLDERGHTGPDVFLRGLAAAVDRGFDVINLSLGTFRRDYALAFHEACDRAYFRNCCIVTAANNSARPSYPSMYASVISVACNLATDPFRFHFNPEPPTEFLAKGVGVEVGRPGGGAALATGNSYAAAHMSGLVALIRSKHPDLRPFQVKTVLWAIATNVLEAAARDIPSRRFSRSIAIRHQA